MKHLFELSYIMLIEYLKKMDIRQGPSRLLIFTIMASWIDIQFSQKKKGSIFKTCFVIENFASCMLTMHCIMYFYIYKLECGICNDYPNKCRRRCYIQINTWFSFSTYRKLELNDTLLHSISLWVKMRKFQNFLEPSNLSYNIV
jgi:hypothetical protein